VRHGVEDGPVLPAVGFSGVERETALRLKQKIARRKHLNFQATQGLRPVYLNSQQISLTMREADILDGFLDRMLGLAAGTERTDPT
jgi:hypothetical protein